MVHCYFHLVLFYVFSNYLWKFLIGDFISWNYETSLFSNVHVKRPLSVLTCSVLFSLKSYLSLVCLVEYTVNKKLRNNLRYKEMFYFVSESCFFPCQEPRDIVSSMLSYFKQQQDRNHYQKGSISCSLYFYCRAFLGTLP